MWVEIDGQVTQFVATVPSTDEKHWVVCPFLTFWMPPLRTSTEITKGCEIFEGLEESVF